MNGKRISVLKRTLLKLFWSSHSQMAVIVIQKELLKFFNSFDLRLGVSHLSHLLFPFYLFSNNSKVTCGELGLLKTSLRKPCLWGCRLDKKDSNNRLI